MRRARSPHRWRWFAAWSIPGALAAFALISAASIGVLVAPAAVVAGLVVARRAPCREDCLGLVLGAGIACAAIGVVNLDYYAGTCPGRENVERLPNGGVRIEGCGGFDPVPFFAVAVALAAAAVVAHAWALRRAAQDGGGRSR